MEAINLSKKATLREQMLGVAAILGLIVLLFRVIYFPYRIAKERINQEISNLTMEREALKKFTEALSQTLAQTATTPERMSRSAKMQILKGTLDPVAQETASLLTQLTARPLLRGITVKKMSDLPPKRENGYTTSGFFLNVQGRFRDMVGYLERVQKVPALFHIDAITLKTIDPQAAQVDLGLSGVLFQREGEENARP